MRALVWHGSDRLAVEEVAEPAPAAREVAFDVKLAGICGSDLHAFRGHGGVRKPPLVLGHEALGVALAHAQTLGVDGLHMRLRAVHEPHLGARFRERRADRTAERARAQDAHLQVPVSSVGAER